MKNYQGSTINEPPAMGGHCGAAWRIRLAPTGQREKPDHDATIDAWLVQCNGAHPFWNHWVVSVISLADLPGVEPAVKQFTDATHELVIVALNPEFPLPSLGPDRKWSMHYLTPIDVAQQFAVPSDQIAIEIGELAVRSIIDGRASPDQDFRSWWKVSLMETARHYREGTHAAGTLQ